LTRPKGTLIGTTVSVFFCTVSVDECLISRLLARDKYPPQSGAFYYWLLLAESHLTKRLFGNMFRRIADLSLPAG
jgi:hypothetical protein